MKYKIYYLLFASLFTTLTSCRQDKATEAEIMPAAEIKEASPAAELFVTDTTSVIEWWGSKPTGTHNGFITVADGEIFVKDTVVQTGRFTIDMKSITVADLKDEKQKRDLENHLKGLKTDAEDHFFNTNNYPVATFELTNTLVENGKMMVEGNLTIKDVTKNIKFPAFIKVKDSTVELRSERFSIDRTLWNINYASKNEMEKLGDQYISKDIELKVNVKANKKY